MPCFLCRYSSHPIAMNMSQFIEENIGAMHHDVISNEVEAFLATRSSERMESDEMGMAMSAHDVREHILTHMLNPVVRTGVTLRNLVELESKMKGDLYKTDAQTGQCMGLDPKMIDSYLRLQTLMMNLHRSDLAKSFRGLSA